MTINGNIQHTSTCNIIAWLLLYLFVSVGRMSRAQRPHMSNIIVTMDRRKTELNSFSHSLACSVPVGRSGIDAEEKRSINRMNLQTMNTKRQLPL